MYQKKGLHTKLGPDLLQQRYKERKNRGLFLNIKFLMLGHPNCKIEIGFVGRWRKGKDLVRVRWADKGSQVGSERKRIESRIGGGTVLKGLVTERGRTSPPLVVWA